MAVKIANGEIISGKVRSGESAKGEWAFTVAKAEKGYDQISIWATNPQDVQGASAVKIVSIESASITNQRKEGAEGTKWYTNYSVTAKLERVVAHNDGEEWATPEDTLEDIFRL